MISALIKRHIGDSRIRYLISGGSSFVMEYGVFSVLIILNTNLFLANSLSFIVGLSLSFLLHKFWSFSGNHSLGKHAQTVAYSTLAGFNLLLTNAAIGVLTKRYDIAPLIAKITIMLFIIIWNYYVMNRIIFKRKD